MCVSSVPYQAYPIPYPVKRPSSLQDVDNTSNKQTIADRMLVIDARKTQLSTHNQHIRSQTAADCSCG
jgi:hypothetical protein